MINPENNKKEPKIWILVLTWNNYVDSFKCLNSVKKLDYSNYEVLVVDNGSTDGSIEKLRNTFPDFNYLINRDNLKFSGGIKRKDGDGYVFLLNNDVIIFEKKTVTRMVSFLENNSNVGIVSALAIYPDRKEQTNIRQLKFPLISSFIFRTSVLGYLIKMFMDFLPKKKKKTPQKVDWVPIGISMIKKDTFEKCLFDEENFPMEFSDVDFCKEVSLKTKYDIFIDPSISIVHTHGFPNSRKKMDCDFLRSKEAEIKYVRKFFPENYVFSYKLINFINSILFFLLLFPCFLIQESKFHQKFVNHSRLLIKIWFF
jgi:GT2 family glycosyltransferase